MAKHITGNTTKPAQGIIPFGSNDEAVILQDSLKAEPSNGEFKVALPDFDSERGMLLGAGGWMFDFSALDFTSLENSGQFSFTIEAIGLGDAPIQTSDFTSIGSDGLVSVGTNYICSWAATNAVGSTPYGRIFTSASKLINTQLNGGDASITTLVTDHTLTDDMIFTVSWTGGIVEIYIDNLLQKAETGQTNTNWMQFFHIGTNRGAPTLFFEQAVYAKDFIISNRPVMTPVHPSLAKVAMSGDSFAAQSIGITNAPAAGYQNRATRVAEAYLRKFGVGINWSAHGVSGAFVYDWTGSLPALFIDQIPGIIAARPQQIVLQIGTNDAGYSDYVEATYESTLQSHITTLLAGITGKIFIGTIPTRKGLGPDPGDPARVASVNRVNSSIPAWWDAANPGDTGRVVVYDLSRATGGEGAADKMLAGLWWDLYTNYENDAHLSSLGRATFGDLLGKTLHKYLPIL